MYLLSMCIVEWALRVVPYLIDALVPLHPCLHLDQDRNPTRTPTKTMCSEFLYLSAPENLSRKYGETRRLHPKYRYFW